MDTEYRESRRGDITTMCYGDTYAQRNEQTGREACAYARRDGAWQAEWAPVYYGDLRRVDSVHCPDRATAVRIVREWCAGRQAGATL